MDYMPLIDTKKLGQPKNKRNFMPVFVMAILVAVAMNMDHDDQLAQQAHYCEMVAEGVWPNSKNLECEQ